MNLINLSQWDQEILYKSKIMFDKSWEHEALQYERIIEVCLMKGIHAGSSLPASWNVEAVVPKVVLPSNRESVSA
jgi:hypothetical protein